MIKQTSIPVNNVISALTARTQLGQILRRATRNNERFVVDRRGEPSIVIMSIKDYVDTMAPAPRWLKDIQASSRRRGTNRLTMKQIDADPWLAPWPILFRPAG